MKGRTIAIPEIEERKVKAMKAEYRGNAGFLQRDSVEHEKYAGAHSLDSQEIKVTEDVGNLLEKILSKDNMNSAYKRVKSNKGAAGIDGMTVDEALPWLREHGEELLESIRNGKFKPSPVRRKEIPKGDGGVRKLGIPTVIDRIIQQAIAQVITPIYEPLFSDGSYGYRPHRSAQQAIQKVRDYAEEGYKFAVCVDLSKYFDTLNHDLLMNMLREQIQDKRVIELIKKYLKSGVMENGVIAKTEEGSPQGGNLSPLLANVYLNKFDHEFEDRGVRVVRYADDIVLLAKSKRAAERLLGTSRTYLEQKLKLKVNEEKSKAVSVYSIRNFKFLGFAMGRNKNGAYIRVHAKSMKKAKDKLRKLTSRSQGRNVRAVMYKVKVFMQGWLGYYSIADMKNTIDGWNGWLRRRIRMYIWKQWKKPKTRVKNLLKLGIPEWVAYELGYSRKAYWRMSGVIQTAITNKRLAQAGYYDISQKYKSLHLCG